VKVEDVKYLGKAKSIGGRDGRTKTSGGDVDVKLTVPKELGGPGGAGTNPEELFAAGYSACFIGAMKFVAGQQKVKLPDDLSIEAVVGIGPITGGFGIETELKIDGRDMDKAALKAIVDKAHTVCPYSNATRGNIDVKLTVL
jgi:osmotically inducible protein OsmC